MVKLPVDRGVCMERTFLLLSGEYSSGALHGCDRLQVDALVQDYSLLQTSITTVPTVN